MIFKVSAIGRVKVLVAEVGLDAFEALPGNDAVEVVPGVPAQLSLMRDLRCCQKPFTSDAQFHPQNTKRAHAFTRVSFRGPIALTMLFILAGLVILRSFTKNN